MTVVPRRSPVTFDPKAGEHAGTFQTGIGIRVPVVTGGRSIDITPPEPGAAPTLAHWWAPRSGRKISSAR